MGCAKHCKVQTHPRATHVDASNNEFVRSMLLVELSGGFSIERGDLRRGAIFRGIVAALRVAFMDVDIVVPHKPQFLLLVKTSRHERVTTIILETYSWLRQPTSGYHLYSHYASRISSFVLSTSDCRSHHTEITTYCSMYTQPPTLQQSFACGRLH